MCRAIFHCIFILSLFLTAVTAQAENYEYAHGYVNLSGQKTHIYVFKNKSDRKLLLDRYLRFNPGMNAGWSSQIDPGKWSALKLDIASFTMSCSTKNPRNRYQRICCKYFIKVLPIKMGSLPKGSFWIAENKTCQELKKQAKARGFQLKSLKCRLRHTAIAESHHAAIVESRHTAT